MVMQLMEFDPIALVTHCELGTAISSAATPKMSKSAGNRSSRAHHPGDDSGVVVRKGPPPNLLPDSVTCANFTERKHIGEMDSKKSREQHNGHRYTGNRNEQACERGSAAK
jgi:hypothetical protein